MSTQGENGSPDRSEHESEKISLQAAPDASDYPDGGTKAWLVVLGGACTTFSTFGFINSWGVFQSYYSENLLKASTQSDIAWIGSLQFALIFFPSLVMGRLFDLGYERWLLSISGAALVIGIFLVAQCRQYWQFLLCQGLLIGLASAGLSTPSFSCITHWFKKRRQFAFGLVALGSSLGGTTMPILTRNLIPKIGFPWTMRVVGFIQALSMGIILLTVRRRFPPVNQPGGLLNLAAFKSAPFSIYCTSAVIIFLGVYTALTYIDVSATAIGIDPDFSFYLVAIANGSSGVGRYFAGLSGDAFGPMNTVIPFTAVSAILTYAWPYAGTKGALIGVAVIYGFCCGVFVTLMGSPVVEFGEIADVGRRVGMLFTILSIGAVAGPPISGAISSATGSFTAVGFYAGSVVLFGVALMLLSRYLAIGKLKGKI